MHTATDLIRRTEEMFDRISLIDGGISIREAIVMDNYGTVTERKEARSKDELTDWHCLVGTDHLKRHVNAGVLCFIDARGMRFYLPPCFVTILPLDTPGDCPEIFRGVLFHLSGSDEQFALLNQPQTVLIRDILLHLEQKTDRWYRRNIEGAIRSVARRLSTQY
ncbi:hypothetical protein FHS27_006580 [Rhodopirellula rubra]|uniref:Uncharacterized protein n=1 Tax=Aporhodopirellula rubra TaxID=980271 RepID=A0A7W5E6J8_9BACT|nr:DUF6714 family protein [Aporhodopirellula rubra]MBB3210732.1 hypothetical protein [Aporhodopirellula rubra]